MIKATFFRFENGNPAGFNIKGHSGYSSHGTDIVCASVSSVAYMTANTISEIMKLPIIAEVNDDGEMTVKVYEKDSAKTRELLLGMELHIKELAGQYPQNVTINTEV